MHRMAATLAVLAVVLMLPVTARAQAYFAPNIGYAYGGDAGNCPALFTDCADKKWSYGVTLGGLRGGIIGFEADLMFVPDFFGQGGSVEGSGLMTLMSNMLIAIPAGRVRPYFAAGIGLMRAHVDLTASSLTKSFSNNDFGYNFGGGLFVLLPHHIGFRGDLRYFRSGADVRILGVTLSTAKLNFTRASVSLVLY